MHGLYFKNFLTTAAMIIISFLLMASVFTFTSRTVLVAEARENMLSNAEEVSRAAEAYTRNGNLRSFELRMTLSSISSSTGRHIFITDPSGLLVSCSDRQIPCSHMGRQMDPTIMETLYTAGTLNTYGDLGGIYSDSHYTVALPLENDRSLTGYVFVSQNTSTALDVWQTIQPLFFLICLAVLSVALVLTFTYSKYMAQPLRDMAAAARRFGHGDLSVRVEDTGRDDELGELTTAFNSMADSLEKSEEQNREFIANVSHELKTPMTTISGFADGILDGTIPPEDQDKYLQIISSETKRLSRLVRSMLELSRLQADERDTLRQKSFDISETLRLTLINFADKIEQRGLDVDFQVPEDPIRVRGDVDAITQVIYNLLDNAVKFAKDGSVIGISLWKNSAKAYVSVRNYGSTIPQAEVPLLFERFHKGDRSRSRNRDGVGLGLHIVKTILNNHGEDIAVTSRDGVTDFVFTLTLQK